MSDKTGWSGRGEGPYQALGETFSQCGGDTATWGVGSRRNQAGQQESAVGGKSKGTPRGRDCREGSCSRGRSGWVHPTPYEAEEETQVVGLTGSDPHPPKEEKDPKMNGVEPS